MYVSFILPAFLGSGLFYLYVYGECNVEDCGSDQGTSE